jgi:hypothetical protein
VAGRSKVYKNQAAGTDPDDEKDKDKDEDKDTYKDTDKDKKREITKKMKLTKQMSRIPLVIHKLINHVFLIINHFKLNRNTKITQSFLFSFIFSHLNINVDETASYLTQISYGFFIEFGCSYLFYKCTRIYGYIHHNSTE